MERKSWVELSHNGGYFSKFDWKPDEYSNFKQKQIEDRKDHKEKQEKLHGRAPFLSNPIKGRPLKHMSDFNSLEFGNMAVGFLCEDDPYDANVFEMLRNKWINDSKMLFGDFKYSQGNKCLSKPNKQHLPEIVGYIKR